MESSIKRIINDIEYVSKITATPEYGCTRFSYSEEDKKVRNYLMNQMKDLGLTIKVDGVGNISAKYGKDNIYKPSVMIGSHIDTVANGGRFDGLAGVITALEVIRVLKENNIELHNPIELIIFAEEEGSNFGITMVGSKVLSGVYGVDNLKNIKNDENVSAYELIKSFGFNVDNIPNEKLKKDEVKAMIELHVEQGGILESKDIPIGIVQNIVGMRTYKINFKGVSNHAGTTPMFLRQDPMVAAAEVITELKSVAKENALPSTVATVGKIHCLPNATNVIPGEVEFYVDIRDVDPKGIEIVSNTMISKIKEVEYRYKVKGEIDLIGESDCVNLSSKVIETIEETAKENKYSYYKMNSGAVHDSAMLTDITNVGMIFVPSINGLSHCPEEDTNFEDIKLGCDLLLNTVIKLASK